jgi:hydroxyacylglutathione hydrolase
MGGPAAQVVSAARPADPEYSGRPAPSSRTLPSVELLQRAVGPLATNVYLLGDAVTGDAVAIDVATPGAAWVEEQLADRGWTLRLIVATHCHWDHTGDLAALSRTTGAPIAVHPLDRPGLEHPEPLFAPFPIAPCSPSVDLADHVTLSAGSIRLEILHAPGHTPGSVCLHASDDAILFSGDTLFASGWGRVDLPGGSADDMVRSLSRLAALHDALRVLPGHGRATTVGRERELLELVARDGRLFA